MILVGDSLGMVVMGRATTVGVTLEEIRHHCTAVAAGASSPLIVGDLPFGTYITADDAARNAAWLLNNAHVDVVKLEGVRHLRHPFGPSFRDVRALYHPTHAVCCALLGCHAYWMLIGACDLMLQPIHVFRGSAWCDRSRPSSARGWR